MIVAAFVRAMGGTIRARSVERKGGAAGGTTVSATLARGGPAAREVAAEHSPTARVV